MQYSDENICELRTRNLFVIAFYFFATVMLLICSYALYVSAQEYLKIRRVVIGEVLASTEFPFHGAPKLVTYLMVASILSWFCITTLARHKLKDIAKPVKSILQLIILAMIVIALYEFIYNFSIWSSIITHNMIKGKHNMDSINVPYPNPKTPWNIIFATKMTLAAFLISSHGFYIMSKTNKQ